MTNPQTPAAGQDGTPGRPRRTLGNGLISVIAAIALISLAALAVGIISLTQPSPGATGRSIPPTTSSMPSSFSAADVAAANKRLCSTFQSVSKAVKVATSAPDGAEPVAAAANARAALVGGALALTTSIEPATPTTLTTLARKLADAYLNYVITAFAEEKADGGDVESATSALREACA